jgi:hypothetical protein
MVIGETRNVVDVDEKLRGSEAQLHEREQALAPGQYLRLIAMLS